MKFLLLALSMMGSPASKGDLLGEWQYQGYVFEGHNYPKSDPALDLRFVFTPDQRAVLKWHFSDSRVSCERVAIFEIFETGRLYQRVIWVSPKNDSSCARDPDMQLEKETITNYQISNDRLEFLLELNGQEFVYILKRIL